MDLYGWLVANTPNTERILMTILLQRDHNKELESTYATKFPGRTLNADLGKLGWADAVRARSYLQHGTLRAADKLYIAIHGTFTDLTTIRRVLPQVYSLRQEGKGNAEQQFRDSYGTDYPDDAKLPNGEDSRLGGALAKEMLAANFSDRFDAWAVLAYGSPRPADQIKIATVDGPAGVQDAKLFEALQRPDIATIKSDFEKSYGQPLKDYLDKELFQHTRLRALIFVDDEVKAEDRLIETVRIATSGYTTADMDFIIDAAHHASPEQIKAFKKAVEDKDARLKSTRSLLGGMNDDQYSQFTALIDLDTGDAMTQDPVVKLLRTQSGTDPAMLFDALRNATGVTYLTFQAAYLDGKSRFRQFVDHYVGPAEKGYLLSYVFIEGKQGYDALKARLQWITSNPGHDDYLIFLLSSFTTDADRKQLAKDSEFGSWFNALSTATRNRVLMVLRPETMTTEERAGWLAQAVKRETDSGAGSLTAAAGALEDENRELQAARARIAEKKRRGEPLAANEQADFDRLAGQTDAALTAFLGYRDQFEAVMQTLVEVAASLLLTAATGGAGVETFALALARAAAAGAMARVVSNKVVLGDRFDVLGAQGAAAFVSGAVDGAINVVGGSVAQKIANPSLNEAAATSARQVGSAAAPTFARTVGAKMVEGAFTSGASSAVDAAVQDSTWADGFDKGMRTLLTTMAKNALIGALPPGAAEAFAGFATLDEFNAAVDALPPNLGSYEMFTIGEPTAPVQQLPTGAVPIQRHSWGPAYETWIDSEAYKGGMGGSDLPAMTYMFPGKVKSDNGLDRIGVYVRPDGTMDVYHFEMKWRDFPKKGASAPSHELKKGYGSVQLAPNWTEAALELLATDMSPSAIAVRAAMRAMLARVTKRNLSAVHPDDVVKFIRSTNTAHRVLVHPPWLDDRRLMKQFAAIIGLGAEGTRIKKAP